MSQESMDRRLTVAFTPASHTREFLAALADALADQESNRQLAEMVPDWQRAEARRLRRVDAEYWREVNRSHEGEDAALAGLEEGRERDAAREQGREYGGRGDVD